jgi:preprotein translocase YajC subunit
VVTIGGIVGTVVATRDDEVVLKVDESTNTKMTFVRKAIQRVLPESDRKT